MPLASGEPGPVEPAANSVSHFQLPSKPFMNTSSSFDGVGIVGIAGAGGALGTAAGRDPGFGATDGPAAAPGFGAGASAAASGRDANVARASSENETTPVLNIETPVLRGRALESNVDDFAARTNFPVMIAEAAC